ncbi:MAG: lytic transglycosylase domain-containing protein [Myxococcales bacterium]|nr:lytic transglycosylase domain-containing protein [Myxococcales bacterium]
MTPSRAKICRSWKQHARRAARRQNLAPELLLAIAWVESGFRAGARSSAGAQGPLQLMPRTSRAFGCYAPRDPSCAFPAAAALMQRLLRRFDGKMVYALCAYNAGAGRVRQAWRKRRLPFNIWYAERVFAAQARLRRRGCVQDTKGREKR